MSDIWFFNADFFYSGGHIAWADTGPPLQHNVIKLKNRFLYNATRSGFYKLSFHYFYSNVIRSGLRKAWKADINIANNNYYGKNPEGVVLDLWIIP